jgi:putative restriction endonuclease
MRYWWVNQNQTYRAEVRGSFMWSPKANANGARNQFYENMRAVAPGDVVFSFCDTRIKAIGVVTGAAATGPKPDFGTAGTNWSQEGWFVPVDYCTLDLQIRPKDHIGILRPFLPSKYSPLQISGDGLQSVYLAELPEGLAEALIGLIGDAFWDAFATISDYRQVADSSERDESIIERGTVGPTFREQLVKARRGQGVFRANVLLRESACRVTRVDEPRHLKASHIKPWRDATDAERLDGSNGLLLSPHVDHLFDEGYITFSASQSLIIVPEVRDKLLDAWGIDAGVCVGEFSREQNAYLDYHRANVFKHAPLGS